MRLVHAADLHLDSPLRGLSRLQDDDVAQQLRQASRRALENLVHLVVHEKARALVLAGDIYDGNWADYATGRFFAEQMGVLHDHGIPVFMAAGNHDAESVITRALTLPPNVAVLSTQRAESVLRDDLGLAVHGQGFARRAVTENLVVAYPERVPGLVNVGILHTAVTGAEGHADYAPCTPYDLERTEYDYFALGHVHEHTVVNKGHRVAAFSGNLQGRTPRETGPKGALVVDVEPDERAALRHVPLDVARWAVVDVDATGAAGLEDVLVALEERFRDARVEAEGRLLVARVGVSGTTGAAATLADRERLHEEVSLVAGRHDITVEQVRSTALAPREQRSVEPELLDSLERAGQELSVDVGRLRTIARPLDREFGRDLRSESALDLGDEELLAALAREAITGLTARLASREN
ncbi:MAG: DNA repair exonuclease [Actinomycetota bacterium]|nr:DNA repair exonuclease [Actinomycetota bacterium]